jgi:hypothetical protein
MALMPSDVWQMRLQNTLTPNQSSQLENLTSRFATSSLIAYHGFDSGVQVMFVDEDGFSQTYNEVCDFFDSCDGVIAITKFGSYEPKSDASQRLVPIAVDKAEFLGADFFRWGFCHVQNNQHVDMLMGMINRKCRVIEETVEFDDEWRATPSSSPLLIVRLVEKST